jgi:hypothetical protein
MKPISIRRAEATDQAALREVAERDSRLLPAGDLLVAVVGTEIRAVLSMHTGEAVADPFHPTAALVELLRIRARQIERSRQGMKTPWTRKSVLSPVVDAVPSAPPS